MYDPAEISSERRVQYFSKLIFHKNIPPSEPSTFSTTELTSWPPASTDELKAEKVAGPNAIPPD